MTPEHFDRAAGRLHSILREIGTPKEPGSLNVHEFVSVAESKARAMTCAAERMKKCEMQRLAAFAQALEDAAEEFRAPKGGA